MVAHTVSVELMWIKEGLNASILGETYSLFNPEITRLRPHLSLTTGVQMTGIMKP